MIISRGLTRDDDPKRKMNKKYIIITLFLTKSTQDLCRRNQSVINSFKEAFVVFQNLRFKKLKDCSMIEFQLMKGMTTQETVIGQHWQEVLRALVFVHTQLSCLPLMSLSKSIRLKLQTQQFSHVPNKLVQRFEGQHLIVYLFQSLLRVQLFNRKTLKPKTNPIEFQWGFQSLTSHVIIFVTCYIQIRCHDLTGFELTMSISILT